MIQLWRQVIAKNLAKRWYAVIATWFVIAIALRIISPTWNSVIKDGDFQFLPADSPSRIGHEALRAAFPEDFARSQMVVVFSSDRSEMTIADRCVALDVARRLTYAAAAVNFERHVTGKQEIDPKSAVIERLRHDLDAAVEFDQQWFDVVRQIAGEEATLGNRRMIASFKLRHELAVLIGDQELADNDMRTIDALRETAPEPAGKDLNTQADASVLMLDQELYGSIEDLWTWKDPVLSEKLGADNPRAKLLALQIREEFMAVQNLYLIESLQRVISDCRRLTQVAIREAIEIEPLSLDIAITGPAAVGADLIRAAKESVDRSEVFAILAVIVTLLLIYRSPLLVFLPLVTIGLALSISINVLSILAAWSEHGAAPWKLLEVYSTTRVFLVVLIFGIGTDLTLFFIVRCRETYFGELPREWKRGISRSWSGVFGAIVGSGLTTTIGLSMMAFSEFAKFRFSGVSIAIALIITLIVCLTFPPAAMAALGPAAFWPRRRATATEKASGRLSDNAALWTRRIWERLASIILRKPGAILIGSIFLLVVPAVVGWFSMDNVTYNLVGELSPNATSRHGQSLVHAAFPRTETSSITVCVTADSDFEDTRGLTLAIEKFRKELFVEGVQAVQALTDPLGEFPPDRTMSLFSQDAWRRRLLQRHPLTQQKFVAQTPELALRAARFEVVTDFDPFSDEAAEVLRLLQSETERIASDTSSAWFNSQAAFAGTTAGIVDLKRVTHADQKRVQVLVVLSVFAVLLVLTRRLELSTYLMVTVLFSYLATLGVSYVAFRIGFGASYEGLDWKVPLFLFVILVAVGQDYNIYLTTRILEEQERQSWATGLREAIVSTGGIITSCGLIMFATFASMCVGGLNLEWLSPTAESREWVVPTLRGISELGFALSFGVLLDTFVIRTVIVPAYIAWRKLA